MLLAEVIASDTGLALGLVVTLLAAVAAGARFMASSQHRLEALEKAQKADNAWRQQNFGPWKSKVDLHIVLVEERLPRSDASQSRTWPKTEGK